MTKRNKLSTPTKSLTRSTRQSSPSLQGSRPKMLRISKTAHMDENEDMPLDLEPSGQTESPGNDSTAYTVDPSFNRFSAFDDDDDELEIDTAVSVAVLSPAPHHNPVNTMNNMTMDTDDDDIDEDITAATALKARFVEQGLITTTTNHTKNTRKQTNNKKTQKKHKKVTDDTSSSDRTDDDDDSLLEAAIASNNSTAPTKAPSQGKPRPQKTLTFSTKTHRHYTRSTANTSSPNNNSAEHTDINTIMMDNDSISTHNETPLDNSTDHSIDSSKEDHNSNADDNYMKPP